jgi:hypothetical protein
MPTSESVQRIVLAPSRSESIGEPKEVFLVDGLENRRDWTILSSGGIQF